jgi:hypothetical protein
MAFEIGGPAPPSPTAGQRLYVTIARSMATLSFTERMALANAISRGDAYLQLPPKFRVMFESIATATHDTPAPGAPW